MMEDRPQKMLVGKPVKLSSCPPGPFLHGQYFGFKTEYGFTTGKSLSDGKVEWTVTHHTDAYVMASGEVFWAGCKTREEVDALIVRPVEFAEDEL